jgi:hypothetical protein
MEPVTTSKESLDPLEAIVEVPCRLTSDAASVHFAAVVKQISLQSSSCSVPLSKFVGSTTLIPSVTEVLDGKSTILQNQIWCDSAAVFPSLKQHFMQTRCSLRSAIAKPQTHGNTTMEIRSPTKNQTTELDATCHTVARSALRQQI